MKTFLAYNLIGVNDVEKAQQWYADVFGMELVELRPPYFCEMKLGEQIFLIEKEGSERAEPFNVIPTGVRTSVMIGTDDMDAFIAHAVEHDAGIVMEPTEQAWGGWTAVIADVDGNEFIVYQDQEDNNG